MPDAPPPPEPDANGATHGERTTRRGAFAPPALAALLAAGLGTGLGPWAAPASAARTPAGGTLASEPCVPAPGLRTIEWTAEGATPAAGGPATGEPCGDPASGPAVDPAIDPAVDPLADPAAAGPIERPAPDLRPAPSASRAAAVHANAVLRDLNRHYRGLRDYEDVTRVERVTEDPYAPDHRSVSDVTCRIDGDGRLTVESAAGAIVRSTGFSLPIRSSSTAERISRDLDLWLAPRLALHLGADPLASLAGRRNPPLRPTEATPVRVDHREFLKIDLRSDVEPTRDVDRDATGGANGVREATLSLWVDPSSMLVERMEGRSLLPDGRTQRTTVRIRPRHASACVSEGLAGGATCEDRSKAAGDPAEPRDAEDAITEPAPAFGGGVRVPG